MTESTAEFELSIASQAKPFPYGPLATAIYINANSEVKNPITITTQPVALHDPPHAASNAKLIRKKEYPPRLRG